MDAAGVDDRIVIADVDTTLTSAFVEYCREHGPEHDDSFTTSEELERFDPAAEPAVVALDGATVVAAASVMLEGYRDLGDGRFRILHSLEPDLYPALLERALARLAHDVKRTFLFLPEDAVVAQEAVRLAGFVATRKAYILSHPAPPRASSIEMPPGTVAREAFPPEARHWAHVVNAAFAGQPSRPDMRPDRAAELLGRRRVIRDGTLIAWRGDAPVGVVMTIASDTDPDIGEIETLAVVPSAQGIGIGRALLRSGLDAIARQEMAVATLSVNAANVRALALYLDLGFHVDEVRVCWERWRGPDGADEAQLSDESV
jgi:ribosomal protein S18 acetylase RimI-like enzyme